MTTIEPHARYPLHSTAAILQEAFKNIVASKPAPTRPTNLRPIIIYGLSDARAAVQAAAEQGTRELALLSPIGVAHSLGPAWFGALIRQAQAGTDEVRITGILDCSHYEGHVISAFHAGITDVYFTGEPDVAEKLEGIAAKHDGILHRKFDEILDLKKQGDQLTACRKWLGRQGKVLRA